MVHIAALIFLSIIFLLPVLGQVRSVADIDVPPHAVQLPLALDLGHAETSLVATSIEHLPYAPLIHFPPQDVHPSAQFRFPALDLSQATGIDVRLTNPGARPLRIYGMLNANPWVTDYVLVPAGASASLRIYLQRRSLQPDCIRTAYPKMNGLPDGQMTLWPEAEVDAAAIHSLTLYTIGLSQPATIRVDEAHVFHTEPSADRPCTAHAFVDPYGQNMRADWPGKVLSDGQLRRTAAAEENDLRRHPAPASFDRFGGWRTGPQLAATGHFRVVRQQGRWWFVDPDGHLFWSNGITTVLYHAPTDVDSRAQLFRDPAPGGDFLARNLARKYGDDWSSTVRGRTFARLRSWGLNTIGPWSDDALTASHHAVYTYIVSSRNDAGKIDPYSDQWYQRLRRQLAEHVALNNDPWCLGIFVDNEIHDSMDAKWWTTYYQKVHTLMRELMPNKLYLGSRLDFADFPSVDDARINVVRIAAQYTDVISMNQYRFTLEDFTLPAGVDRPVLVGEFHFGALDRGLLHTGLRSVRDQQQRAEAYTHYVESALRNPNLVGVHWFQMYDEPVTGRGDGENYQIGFLDICDQPYVETIAASRRLARHLYVTRARHLPFTR
jgi:hypothetical protein